MSLQTILYESESREFSGIPAKEGAKAAIAWHEARLAKQSESE